MTNVYFTSDLHFGHKKVSELRGFTTPEEHDATLMDNWSSVVTKRDTVWVLGDLTLASPTAALEIIKNLPGTKHFISGNHDGCHPMHKDYAKVTKHFLEAFESVAPYARRKLDGREVLLSHFPYEADRGEARYMQWRLPDLGANLLHGHTHSPEYRTSDHELQVGVDAHGLTPVPMATIIEMLRNL